LFAYAVVDILPVPVGRPGGVWLGMEDGADPLRIWYEPCPIGQFLNETLHGCTPCTDLPADSFFISRGVPRDADTCEFQCHTGWWRNGTERYCTTCSSPTCGDDKWKQACSTNSDTVCRDCESRLPPYAKFVAQIGNDTFQLDSSTCPWLCDVNFFRSDHFCVYCSEPECPPGFHRSPCTPLSDAACVPCNNTKPANSVYITNGYPAEENNCEWGCAAEALCAGRVCASATGQLGASLKPVPQCTAKVPPTTQGEDVGIPPQACTGRACAPAA